MEIILIILAIILAGVAVSKVLQARELVDGLKHENADPITDTEMRTNALGLLVYGLVLFALLIAQIVGWQKYMLPSSASVHGVEIDGLMDITMVLILFVFSPLATLPNHILQNLGNKFEHCYIFFESSWNIHDPAGSS